jgi:hypothetical protein
MGVTPIVTTYTPINVIFTASSSNAIARRLHVHPITHLSINLLQQPFVSNVNGRVGVDLLGALYIERSKRAESILPCGQRYHTAEGSGNCLPETRRIFGQIFQGYPPLVPGSRIVVLRHLWGSQGL